MLHYFPRLERISGPFGAAPFSARQKGLYIRPEQPVFTNQERDLIHLAHSMSDKDGGRNDTDDTDVLVETKPKTKRPPLYKVLLLNDDYTPMEFVVEVLERFFGITHAAAIEIMLTVHKKGLAVVGVFPYEVAETKVTQVMDLARKKQHPLQCTMEKE
ncbi:MAG: ATP-dependent Clp protease adaptor protein ClpS [Halocynthiibacter sp.]